TDGKVHEPSDPESPADDRLAFTTATTALNYGSAAALAAASRALRGYNDALAEECLATARKAWEFEQGREPNLFRVGNTTGGHPDDGQLRAAVQLLLSTGEAQDAEAIRAPWPSGGGGRFGFNIPARVAALAKVDQGLRDRVRERAVQLREQFAPMAAENPCGVVITRGGWAGNGAVVGMAIANYHLHKAFPDLFDAAPTLRGLDYLYGTHPDSNISFVSAVGARS